MKRRGILIGSIIASIFILFTSCGTDSMEGEYGFEGRGPSAITILDNGTAELMFDGYRVVEYEKKRNRLEVIEKDVYLNFENPITQVHFELIEDDLLLYTTYEGEELYAQSEWERIPGSDGESGESSFFSIMVKAIFLVGVMYVVLFAGMALLSQWLDRRNSST